MTDALEQEQERLRRLRSRAEDQRIGAGTRAEEHALAVHRWALIHRLLVVAAAIGSAGASASLLNGGDSASRLIAGCLSAAAALAAATDLALGARETLDGHKRGLDGFTRLRTQWLLLGDRVGRPTKPPSEED